MSQPTRVWNVNMLRVVLALGVICVASVLLVLDKMGGPEAGMLIALAVALLV